VRNACTPLLWFQEIRNSGAIGYKYITVDEDEAANVIYANNVLLHLGNEQIPRGAAVSSEFYWQFSSCWLYWYNHDLLYNW
jgi:hypothetical protein